MSVKKALESYGQMIRTAVLALVILGPIFYYRTPLSDISPDILYVKAKVLQVLQGRFFADPITGYDTLHPPFYHLFLALFKAVGFSLETVLILVTISNLLLLIFTVYKVVRVVFDSETGYYTCLMVPFIVECAGCGGILLASSFYFSIPFYLAGLWLYLGFEKSQRMTVLAAIFWGLAFLISPVYIFLVVLTFLYEAVIRRNYKRSLKMVITFLVTITPFFVQVFRIYTQDLWGTSVFAVWRGIPDWQWWHTFLIRFISPATGRIEIIPTVLHSIVLLAAVTIFFRIRKIHWYIPLSLAAYFLTFYHFNFQYAIRIHLFISIFIVAAVISGIKQLKLNKDARAIIIFFFVILSVYQHYSTALPNFQMVKKNHTNLQKSGGHLWRNMDKYLKKNRYIFCTKADYREYILGRFPAYSLGAWRTLEYYQLNSEIADMLDIDYYVALTSDDYEKIKNIADKYNIEMALISADNQEVPLFKTLMERWNALYMGDYFCIVERQD